MQIGIVLTWESTSNSGSILSSRTEVSFNYGSGRSVISSSSEHEPELSSTHNQGDGFKLKLPRIGDSVVFFTAPDGSVQSWGYAEHYVGAAVRKFGSGFILAPQAH